MKLSWWMALTIIAVAIIAPTGGNSTTLDGTIYGHVYDDETKEPVSSAFIRCEGETVITDAEGYYSLVGGFAPSTTYTLIGYASGYQDTSKTIKTDPNGKAEVDLFLGSSQSDQPAKESIATEKIEYHPFGDTRTNILEGRWILNLDDAQISMVLYQSGDLLFGAANSETPEPWNGVVSGSAEEDQIELEILSLQGGVLVSTLIKGIATEGTLAGSFVQSDSSGQAKVGNVMGFLTSPETSGYEPAD